MCIYVASYSVSMRKNYQLETCSFLDFADHNALPILTTV